MLKELPTKSPLPSEIDFSQGKFWQIPLGQAVREFTVTEIINKEISFPVTTAQTASLLRLKLEGRSSYFIAGLINAGLLTGVERDAERHYMLKFEHVLDSGIALLLLENGYPLSEIREKLVSLLEGTSLLSFVGKFDNKKAYTYRLHNIFAEDSPWLKFPLEAFQTQNTPIKSSKQEPDDKLEENPRDKWVPEDKRLLIIPKISSELIPYNKEKIESLLNDFNNIPDNADARDYLKWLMIQNIMFVLAAHERRLSEYDRKKEFYTISETRAGIKACFEEWVELEQEQKIINFFHLFQLVELKVRKNTDMYWSSTKTVVE